MKHHPSFRALWYLVNFLLLFSVVLLPYSVVQEYSTRRYLQGYADAIVPLSASPREKVEAILAWMHNGPARREASPSELLASRNPEDTLNYAALLKVCGSATNAFVNLARRCKFEVRRLLLFDENSRTMHVLAEVNLGSRWVVVDPAFHTLMRDASGRLLTKEDLRNPQTLREATAGIAGYDPRYTFERTAHVRVERLPLIGGALRSFLNRFAPGWDGSPLWTLLTERRSFALLVFAVLMFVIACLLRLGLSWYGEQRLGVTRVRLRDQMARALRALFVSPD